MMPDGASLSGLENLLIVPRPDQAKPPSGKNITSSFRKMVFQREPDQEEEQR